MGKVIVERIACLMESGARVTYQVNEEVSSVKDLPEWKRNFAKEKLPETVRKIYLTYTEEP